MTFTCLKVSVCFTEHLQLDRSEVKVTHAAALRATRPHNSKTIRCKTFKFGVQQRL